MTCHSLQPQHRGNIDITLEKGATLTEYFVIFCLTNLLYDSERIAAWDYTGSPSSVPKYVTSRAEKSQRCSPHVCLLDCCTCTIILERLRSNPDFLMAPLWWLSGKHMGWKLQLRTMIRDMHVCSRDRSPSNRLQLTAFSLHPQWWSGTKALTWTLAAGTRWDLR